MQQPTNPDISDSTVEAEGAKHVSSPRDTNFAYTDITTEPIPARRQQVNENGVEIDCDEEEGPHLIVIDLAVNNE